MSTRPSGIPADYDPTPNYDDLPEGYERPETSCWVAPSIAKPLKIEDLHHLWSQPTKNMPAQKRKHRFLAGKVVSVRGEFWVKDRRTGLWLARRKGHEVKSALMHDWGREQTRYQVRKDTIDTFFAGQEFIVLDGTIYLPGAGDFVQVRGRRYLNSYHEPPMAYREGAFASEPFFRLMELIVLNLMGRDQGAFDDWVEEIFGTENTDLKWLFHWMASQYQRPGKALPTAVWFVGRAQGIGKGTLTSGLAYLLGRSNAKTVSPEEFKGEWTDFMVDTSFIILDEIDFGSRKAAYDKIKRLIGNDLTAARKRNHGDIIVPSVCNFIFTTNNTSPVAMDQGDRRNTVFGTKNTPEAKERARAFYALRQEDRQLAWEGLAEVLALIDIDDELISHAFPTEMKERMIENNINPVEEWLLAEETLQDWPYFHFAPSQWLYTKYATWMKENDGYPPCIDKKYFHRMMGEMSDLGLVSGKERKTLNGDAKYRGYVRYDPDQRCDNIRASDAPFVDAFNKSAKVIELQTRGKKKAALRS